MISPQAFTVRHLILAAVLLLAAAIALWSPATLGPTGGVTLAIVLVTLGLWATALVPGYFASLLLFSSVLIAGLQPAPLVFSGFASAAVWLIISGFVIGAAVNATGLDGRLAGVIAPFLTRSYPRLIGGLMLASMILGFLMPSSVGRAVVMVPIGMALADRCGFAKGSNGRIGIAAILAIGCNMPSFAILPSNIPNMVLAGSAETILGIHFTYTDYLLLHYPVLGIVKSTLTVALVLALFPAQVGDPLGTVAVSAATGKSGQGKVIGILILTLIFWMTDSLHGINSAWIGLGAAVLLLAPGIDVVGPQAFRQSIDFGLLLFVAGALALGALVGASGLGSRLGAFLTSVLPLAPGNDAANFFSLTFLSFVTSMFTTVPSAPAVLTPMTGDLATLTGYGATTVLMTQVVGFSTVLFPYQVGPLVVAMQLSGEKLDHLVRVTVPLALITLVVLVPIDFLWWKLLGWL
ncbi:sodium:sulfate symporter [Pleomorphomonas diazotrophica]|uniref:Sodium:sulfate symporter n=1 Tax=Pleomorphomonas diazotrophica TaxID=1166257 RepID=A0A1I4QQQ2_9HYPH|nr:SLC13 family permease [Pleomorphomonas diazotrophica]PKR90510.1 sodium:sulfate symporter [Pleomorphomonas diazotrophica]SFM42026.1 Di-and tricarboxylate transporter [Pleomorphomonas diazotrophica]